MQYLDKFIKLLANTNTRDHFLRLAQYATVHSEDHQSKGATFNAYTHIRRTRKWLRFLRTIEFLKQLKADLSSISKNESKSYNFLKVITALQTLFKILFYLFDHHVVLGQLEILPKDHATRFYPKSMKMYLLQNLMGALKSILEIALLIKNGKLQKSLGQDLPLVEGQRLIRSKSVQFLRNLLDIFVACYYLNQPIGLAPRVGVIGILTSLIMLAQSLKLI